MKKKKLLVADLLCGAGGSSTGAKRAIEKMGFEMELVCLNHWPVAIDTHQRNHPEARHYVQDIATVRPHLIVPEGYLDLLMASPTCTHHSNARGGKPTSDQQRSDPWHIITWLTELRVKRIIIENVWEFIKWGPVNHRTGKPVKSREGEYFMAWIQVLKRLGFDPEWRKLNAADYGDATTRSRFILMARSDGKKVYWPMPTHQNPKKMDGDLFAAAKPWKPAREIIDWSKKGKSIYGRKKPLAQKTLARIFAGALRHDWPEPYLIVLRNHMITQGMDVPLPTIAANGQHLAIAQPVVVNMKGKSTATSVDVPLPSQTAHAAHLFAAEPIILSQSSSGAARSTDNPLPTIMTGGAGAENRPGCARPMLVTVAHGNDPKDKNPDNRRQHSIEDPLGAVHGSGVPYALVEPFVLSQASGGSARGVSSPIPAAPTGGAHALISPYYGSGSGETCTHVDESLPTITAKGRFGMVVPVTNSNGGAQARDAGTEPLPTLTTAKGGEFAVVLPLTHAGGLERVRDTETSPLPTVTGANRGELGLAATEESETYDILFRMLEPHELAAAMGFIGDDQQYEFAGTKTQIIKQIGNAVSVAKMEACATAILSDLAGSGVRMPAPFKEAAE